MYALLTLGQLSLNRAGVPLPGFDVHRKPLAILAILAMEGSVSRDRLMALLWPDSDTARARGSLKQALHQLRQLLDTFDIVQGSSVLSLDAATIETDVGRFQAALDLGDLTGAVAIYGGPFLEGVHLAGAAEFEQWVDNRRADLARRWADAVERLAADAEARGDARGAAEWWRRRQGADPADSRVAVRLMQALEACGHRAAALEHGREHQRRLREEWDLPPDPAVGALAERLLVGAPDPALPLPSPPLQAVPSDHADPVPVVPGSRRSRRGSWLAAAAVLIAAVGAGAIRTLNSPTDSPTDSGMEANLLAIAPFEVPDTSLHLWREGLADILSMDLDGAGPLRTVPQSVVHRRWTGRIDRVSAAELGRRTGAELVVFGHLTRRGSDSVGLRVALLDRSRSAVESELEVVGEESRLGQLADSLGVQILRTLSRTRAISGHRHQSISSRSLPALKEFLRGEQFYRQSLWDSAFVRYERAVAEDSTFALALRRLAWVSGWRSQAAPRGPSGSVYIQRAASLNRGLSPRDSALLTADSLFLSVTTTRSADALIADLYARVRILEELTLRHPDDPEIWYMLGERRIHGSPPVGGFPGPALDAFERAIVLDSGFTPAYDHVVQLAIQLRRPELAAAYARAYTTLNSTGLDAPAVHLTASILSGGGVGSAPVSRQVASASAATLVTSGHEHLRWWTDSAETAVALLRALLSGRRAVSDATPPAADSLMWRQHLAGALAFRGRLRAAAGAHGRLLNDASASPFSAANDPFDDLAILGVIADSISRRTYGLAFRPDADWGEGFIFLPPRYLRGLPWWLSRGDTVSIARFGRRAAETVRRADSPKAVLRGRYLGAAAAAYLALARGDSASAERLLRAIPDTLCLAGACFVQKLTLAQLLAARGEDRAAAEILDQWTTAGGARPAAVLAALERARIAERLEEWDVALERYRFVTEAWRQPDPELQARLAEARAGLERIREFRR